MIVDKYVQNLCIACVKSLGFTHLFPTQRVTRLLSKWISYGCPKSIPNLCSTNEHQQKTNINLFKALMHSIHSPYHYYYHI